MTMRLTLSLPALLGLLIVGACSGDSGQPPDAAAPAKDLLVDTAQSDGASDQTTGTEGGAPLPDQRPSDVVAADRQTGDSGVPSDQAVDQTSTASCQHPQVSANCASGWCRIPAGCFVMGAAPQEKCHYNTAPHEVKLSRGFEIMQHEATRADFEALMGYGDGWSFSWLTGEHAQDQRTWHEAAAYCNELSASLNLASCYSCTGSQQSVQCEVRPQYLGSDFYACPGVRLPTSAEWEYAYRAGTTTAYYNGVNEECTGADSTLDIIAWYRSNSGSTSQQVGQKAANAWGVHDMAGNVAEWTQDWIHPPNTPDTVATDPLEELTGEYRVHRGGNWNDYPANQRAASIGMAKPASQLAGIRCVRPL